MKSKARHGVLGKAACEHVQAVGEQAPSEGLLEFRAVSYAAKEGDIGEGPFTIRPISYAGSNTR